MRSRTILYTGSVLRRAKYEYGTCMCVLERRREGSSRGSESSAKMEWTFLFESALSILPCGEMILVLTDILEVLKHPDIKKKLECSCFTVLLFSAVQQSESAACIHIHIPFLFWVSFPFMSPQSIEWSSLNCTVGSLLLSILCIEV